jgi:hypothetical protein
MKHLALILSFIIFSQSLSVCGPSIAHNPKREIISDCKVNFTDLKNSKTHSCCSKIDKPAQKEEKKDCCGDDCTCFCCVKVFINSLDCYKTSDSDLSPVAEKNISAIRVHSFDFHPSISYPPQV